MESGGKEIERKGRKGKLVWTQLSGAKARVMAARSLIIRKDEAKRKTLTTKSPWESTRMCVYSVYV